MEYKMMLYIDFKRGFPRYQQNHADLLNKIDNGDYSIEKARTLLEADIDQAIELEDFANNNELETCIADLERNVTVGEYLTKAKRESNKILNSIGRGYKRINKNEYLAPAPSPEPTPEDEDENGTNR